MRKVKRKTGVIQLPAPLKENCIPTFKQTDIKFWPDGTATLTLFLVPTRTNPATSELPHSNPSSQPEQHGDPS